MRKEGKGEGRMSRRDQEGERVGRIKVAKTKSMRSQVRIKKYKGRAGGIKEWKGYSMS